MLKVTNLVVNFDFNLTALKQKILILKQNKIVENFANKFSNEFHKKILTKNSQKETKILVFIYFFVA